MSAIQNISRRDVLKGASATGAVVLGAYLAPHSLISSAKAAASSVQPNLFVSIDADGSVTLTCSRSEMGQGVRTGMPMILADELEADWNRVKIWQAPGNAEKYDPSGKDGQNTDGSRSTRHGFDVMRELGATARYVLEQAAARKWGRQSSPPQEIPIFVPACTRQARRCLLFYIQSRDESVEIPQLLWCHRT